MIVCGGEALVDVLPGGVRTPGGGPMNAAVAAARLGSPTAFLGRLSTDADGDAIVSHLEQSGVDQSLVERGPEPTAQAVVETHPIQRFSFFGDNTADTYLSSKAVANLPADTAIVHGGTLGCFRGQTAEVLADLIERFDGFVSFDPNIRPQIISNANQWWRFAKRWLARADLVRGSDEDFDWMGVSPSEILAMGPKCVVRTLGAVGVEVYLPDLAPQRVSAEPIKFVDAVGAGDSFCGALLHQIDFGGWPTSVESWVEAAGFATQVAGITCSRAGANPPWASEVAA